MPSDLSYSVDLKVILVVEDDPDHAEMIKDLIQQCDGSIVIHTVHRGRQALDYLFGREPYSDRHEFPLPRFVLLDIGLPDIRGHEVLDSLRTDEAREKDLHLIPVVVLSSSSADTDVRAAYEKHANSYLTKPGDAAEWEKLLESTATYWSQLNRHP